MSDRDLTNSELKISFDSRFDRVDEILKEIKEDLKKVDGDLRGDRGNVGLNTRMDRLETSKRNFFWVVSILALGAVNHYFSLIEKVAEMINK